MSNSAALAWTPHFALKIPSREQFAALVAQHGEARAREILGEITLVLAGVEVGSESKTAEDAVARVREYEGAGMDRKGAIATVVEEFGIPKKIVYAAVVDANKMSK